MLMKFLLITGPEGALALDTSPIQCFYFENIQWNYHENSIFKFRITKQKFENMKYGINNIYLYNIDYDEIFVIT